MYSIKGGICICEREGKTHQEEVFDKDLTMSQRWSAPL